MVEQSYDREFLGSIPRLDVQAPFGKALILMTKSPIEDLKASVYAFLVVRKNQSTKILYK